MKEVAIEIIVKYGGEMLVVAIAGITRCVEKKIDKSKYEKAINRMVQDIREIRERK